MSTTVAKANSYYLGLDAGNTVIKAVLFDAEGRQVALHALDGHSATPAPGHVERDIDELWRNATQAIRGCIQKAGIDAAGIAAIGCAGHGNGLYLLDRDGGSLLGVQSLDTRAAGMADQLRAEKGDALHALCLQKPWPAQTPMLLAWIRQHRPALYAQIGTVLLCKDVLTYRLTGERVSDLSDMSGCGLTRMPECRYDDTLLALYGLSDAREMLPRLIDPAEVAGTVTPDAAEATGLVAGTPVIGGYFDVIASAMGSGVVSEGEASLIAGTWGINQVFSARPAVDPTVFMVAAFGPDRFVNIESSATSAANLEWYVREFVERGAHHDDPFGYCNSQIGNVAPGKDDPFYHPFLYGSGQGAEFRAGFYGIAGWHSEGHLLRALFEGVMFEHRRHVEVLKSAGLPIARAVLSGGGSRSPHWPQMFADCLGIPITVSAAQETGALGAAIGAACATGEAAHYEEAVARMTRVARRIEPVAEMAGHYAARYDTYLDLIETMRGFWSRNAR
ncbi:FGGY-family carbohydrate kinase [Pukyongiella litopenaei]|uniref:Carbohydrate kinase n=1 Tax=Pukyongiella litopenaei TaxID=2605946 RepID=A0A2S0MP74_9RHOB|nr:FGGY-family carbohydrate kinase [Pukyongiella litopenaei]AVO37523.1 carbohydrate kinase [Pukyongiella litopenaei]